MGNQKAVRLLGKMSPYQTRRHRALGRHQGRNPFSAVRDVAVIPGGGTRCQGRLHRKRRAVDPSPSPGAPSLVEGTKTQSWATGESRARAATGQDTSAGFREVVVQLGCVTLTTPSGQ